jgi:uncharacterized cupin superfamily protein
MGYSIIRPDGLDWVTRPHEPDEAPRHVAALTELAGFEHTRANLWCLEPGSKGRRHRELIQEETFVVLQGTLTMYLGEPPLREVIPAPGVVRVAAGTPLQLSNAGETDVLVFAYGAPPEAGQGEMLDSVA